MAKNNVLSQKEFIKQYMTAAKIGFTKEQLTNYLGIQIDSLRRRKLSVKKETGVELPELKSGKDNVIPQDKLEKFLAVLEVAEDKPPITGYKRYVITSAQNATPVHQKFLNTLLSYCRVNNARLLVIPYRYKNPTSVWTQNSKGDEWWAPQIKEFICDDDVRLCDSLIVVGKVKMQPTATEPLLGMDSYTHLCSAIFGHPKVQLKTVPTPNKKLPKILTTTGSVTDKNYTDSKAGWKGNFHHSFAATVIELEDDGTFHLRQINADDIDGSFYDLNRFYNGAAVSESTISALVTGDEHAIFADDKVKHATYLDDNSIVKMLKPKSIVRHDSTDFYSRSHHHNSNFLLQYAKHLYAKDANNKNTVARNNVEAELQITADYIDETTPAFAQNIIVKSNHDEAFDRWLSECNPKDDPENAMFYFYMRYNQYKYVTPTETGFTSIDPFEFWCSNPESQTGLKCVDQTTFLNRDQDYMIEGIEVGFHGDVGPNGSRGNIKQFSKIGPKTIIAHSHSCGIYEGCFQVGVSAKLNLEYRKGPSSWLHTHCIIYPNGSRTLINIINGKWKI
jgi:hypothetical protein